MADPGLHDLCLAMIYFANKPDLVFATLLDLALAQLEGETEEGWRRRPSEASRCFSLELARSSLTRILEAHRSEDVGIHRGLEPHRDELHIRLSFG